MLGNNSFFKLLANKGQSGPVDNKQIKRPILGANRCRWSSVECCPDSWSFKDADISPEVMSPSVLSPFGSPSKTYSPSLWPQSVHPFESKKTKNLVMELYSDDSKIEFANNGRDVPLDNEPMETLPLPKYMQPKPKQYELFGNNGFSYARTESMAVGDNDFKNHSKGFTLKTKRRIKSQTFCSFCKNNNETPEMFNSHVVKDLSGRTTCPVLRNYDCPLCHSGGGDYAHTIRYCPKNRPGNDGFVQSVIKVLKNSRSADGKKRGNSIH